MEIWRITLEDYNFEEATIATNFIFIYTMVYGKTMRKSYYMIKHLISSKSAIHLFTIHPSHIHLCTNIYAHRMHNSQIYMKQLPKSIYSQFETDGRDFCNQICSKFSSGTTYAALQDVTSIPMSCKLDTVLCSSIKYELSHSC